MIALTLGAAIGAVAVLVLLRRPGRPTMAQRQRNVDRALRDMERRVK